MRLLRRLIRALSSLRLTLAMFVALATIFVLSTIIPQKSLLQKKLYLDWQASSPKVVWALEQIGFTDVQAGCAALRRTKEHVHPRLRQLLAFQRLSQLRSAGYHCTTRPVRLFDHTNAVGYPVD